MSTDGNGASVIGILLQRFRADKTGNT